MFYPIGQKLQVLIFQDYCIASSPVRVSSLHFADAAVVGVVLLLQLNCITLFNPATVSATSTV